jgi:hypothetical protein
VENKEAHRRIVELSSLMQYDDDVEESRVKVMIPQKSKPVDIKQTEEVLKQQEDDSDDEVFDDV